MEKRGRSNKCCEKRSSLNYVRWYEYASDSTKSNLKFTETWQNIEISQQLPVFSWVKMCLEGDRAIHA